MKKIQVVFIIVLGLFLQGCENDTISLDENELPSISLNGDDVIEVEQYEDYEDLGASVLGDFSLEIITTSNVDTMNLGTYTVVYSTQHLGVEYIKERTVNVVESSKVINFEFELDNIRHNYNSLVVDIYYEDVNNAIDEVQAILFNDSQQVKMISLTSGDNTLRFNGLEEYTEYTLKIAGKYHVDEIEFPIDEEVLTYLTLYQYPIVLTLENTDITFNSYSSDITVTILDNRITDTRFVLWKDTMTVESIDDFADKYDGVNFEGLYSNSEYKMVLQYTMIFDNDYRVGYSVDIGTFLTLPYPEPIVNDFTCEQVGGFIDCNLDLDITGLINVVPRVLIRKNGEYYADLLFKTNTPQTLLEHIPVLEAGDYYTFSLYIEYDVEGSIFLPIEIYYGRVGVTTVDPEQ